jgi:hypothetical protein
MLFFPYHSPKKIDRSITSMGGRVGSKTYSKNYASLPKLPIAIKVKHAIITTYLTAQEGVCVAR